MKNAKRNTYCTEMLCRGPIEKVFPLLCPVREYEWLDGWSCVMVYSDSGVAELGAVFQTQFPDVGLETWTISRYEPNKAIGFVRVAANVVVVKMEFELMPTDDGNTLIKARHAFTALSHAGRLQIEALSPELHAGKVRALESSLNHFLATGTRLAAARLHAEA